MALTLVVAVIPAPVLLYVAASARAVPGPRYLATGFAADTLLSDPGLVSTWFPHMEQLGSGWVRIRADWATIAPARPPAGFAAANPADPHYSWTTLDHGVKVAAAAHQHIVLMLETAPAWALGPGAQREYWPGTWRPNANAYGAFAHAVAERYSGYFADPENPGRVLPRLSYFQAWNEPNLRTHLEPEWTRSRHGFVPAAPTIYRGLLNAAYTAVKSVQPHAYVLAAGLAPYGDPPGVDRMHPVTFLSQLLCLDSKRCTHPAHFDAIDIHPYALTPTLSAYSREDVSVPDIGRLRRVLSAAERAGTTRPRGFKPIWMTEIEWDSSPPDPLGIPLDRQARYLSQSFYEMWAAGVTHVFWYEVRDPGNLAKSFTGGGLFFSNGAAKPAAAAFRFPFVALRRRGKVTLWGRTPVAGRVTVEALRPDGWRRVSVLRATRGGVFYARLRLVRNVTLRARVGSISSYPWPTG